MHARLIWAATVFAVSLAAAKDANSRDEGRKLLEAGQFAEASRVLTPLGATSGEAFVSGVAGNPLAVASLTRRTSASTSWARPPRSM